MPASGAKGISSGLQSGGMKPSTEKVSGALGRIDTPGAQSAPTEQQPGQNDLAEGAKQNVNRRKA